VPSEIEGEKPDKVPRQIAHPSRNASSTDPDTWGTFDDACEAYFALMADPRWAPLNIAGIGVILQGDGLVCIDLDGRVTPEGLTADVAGLLPKMPTFTEISPSATGLHIWVAGTITRNVKAVDIEAYDRARFIAVTGQRWPGTPAEVEHLPRVIAAINKIAAPPRPTTPAPRAGAGRVRRQTPIPKGTRDNTLYRIASGMVAEGTIGEALEWALNDANLRLCLPPLPEADVRRITRSAEKRR
jgi:Primase C terminal 1 (PriCT-1)